MIGGTIHDFWAKNDIVTFIVQEKESPTTFGAVKAQMDEHSQKLIDIGSDIWWHGGFIYLRIGDVPDCKFKKIGFSFNPSY